MLGTLFRSLLLIRLYVLFVIGCEFETSPDYIFSLLGVRIIGLSVVGFSKLTIAGFV